LDIGEICFSDQKFAGCGEPVFGKGGLQIRYGFSFDADQGVAPARAAFHTLVPLIGNARAAYERYFSIHDQKFAVSAIVDAQDAIQTEFVVAAHTAAGIENGAKEGMACTDAPERIQGYVDLHTGTRTLREGVDIHAPDLALVEYVSLKADTALCATDGVQRGGVEMRSVGEDVQFPAAVDLGIGKRFKDGEKLLRVVGRHFLGAADAILRRGSEKPPEQVGSDHDGSDATEHKYAGGYGNGQKSEHRADL